MLSTLKNIIQKLNKVVGIELVLLTDDTITFHAVTLKLEKNKIVKEKELTEIHSWEDLTRKVSAGDPIALTLNGKGILHKKIIGHVSGKGLFESALPNANPNDFYLQSDQQENFTSVSIIRKEVLDGIVKKFEEHNFKVLSVMAGPGSLQFLLPYLNIDKRSVLRSSLYNFRFDDDHRLTDIETIPISEQNDFKKTEY